MADFHELTSNPDEISKFWADFLATESLDPSTPNLEPWHFGDSAELADKLLDIVLNGPKRATASCVEEYEIKGDPLPQVGELSIVLDGSKRPRAILRSTDIRIGPLSSVDDQFAWDEGEGDRSRRYWLDAHIDCFARDYERLGLEFHANIPVVFERFELLYTVPDPAD